MRSSKVRVFALWIVVHVVSSASYAVADDDRPFGGLYGGVQYERQNLIGGSLVDGVDFLQHDTRGAVDFLGGARYGS